MALEIVDAIVAPHRPVTMASFRNLPVMLLDRAAARPKATALRHKYRGIWKDVCLDALVAKTRLVAMGLRALGMVAGDVVAILAHTGPDWVFADLGILGAGGISFGFYLGDTAAHVAAMLEHTAARFIFVQDAEQYAKVPKTCLGSAALRRVVIFDMQGLHGLVDPAYESFAAFLGRGARYDETHPGVWEADVVAIAPEAPAMILQTPGTDGDAKTVLLTHANILAVLEQPSIFPHHMEGQDRLAFLPMAHTMERILGLYYGLSYGVVGNYVENDGTVQEDLREVRPSVLVAPPRFWEQHYANVTLAAAATTALQRLAYRWALKAGRHCAATRDGGQRVTVLRRCVAGLGRLLVLRRVRQYLGFDHLRIGYVGGDRIAPELRLWYRALGIDLVEIYGPAESSGFVCTNPAEIGKPTARVEIRVANDGEILLRGNSVFAGHWNAPEQTRARWQDGWLHTGDIGRMTGCTLRIAGRRSAVIALPDGTTMLAAELEAELRFSPYIASALVATDVAGRVVCLVLIEHASTERWAQQHGIAYTGFASLAGDPAVQMLVASEIARMPNASAIRQFRIIAHKIAGEDREMTALWMLRRPVMHEVYRDLIEGMHATA
ncbi:long-chain fatty acid--CoA ligase [Acidisphaera sp. L21]|uniref:AMP-dependent synthetase/ligase n=1 Tax=Acidisphaera sp. L21 TaxID=1641851 RepID=UPI00131D3B84|nr:AMP-binding protein [Acidisphaera sp. L21]